MIEIPYFEPLDLPNDITIIYNDEKKNYIFKLIDEQIYFRIFFENNIVKGLLTNNMGVIESNKPEYFCYELSNVQNINDILWKISKTNYDLRIERLECITRLSNLKNQSNLKKINNLLKDLGETIYSDDDN
jgi:hypothetical protein